MMKYAKAITAILGAAVTAALGLVPQGGQLFTVLTILAAALTAAGVYLVPNATTDDAGQHVADDTEPGLGE